MLFRPRYLSALCVCVPIVAFAQTVTDVRINGSETVGPLIEAAAAQFKKAKGNVTISVEAKGTSTGFAALCDGKTDIAMASRAITVKEVLLCKSRGVAFIEIPVAWDAVVIVANRNDGWLRDMSLAELRLLWGIESSGKKLTWNQVRNNYPATPVTLFGLDQKSGTFDFFSNTISGTPKVMRADYQESAEHAVVIDRVSKTPGAIGYVSLAMYADQPGKVAALALDEGNGAVLPSTQTVVNGQYSKMSRLLFIYISKASSDTRPNVRDFASFLVEGAPRFATYARFVPLTASNYQEQSIRLKRGDVASVYTK